ncbi:MAG: hypothetical protein ACRDLA_03620 [Thermoleophilaceae bacterium]
MADVIRLEKGYSPWRPASDAQLVKEYAYHDMPLAGIIEQLGVRYYFGCVVGHDDPANIWYYTRVDDEEEAALDNATVNSFDSAIAFHGPGMLALALEGPGIVAVYLLDPVSTEEIQLGYRALVAELEEGVQRARELIPG